VDVVCLGILVADVIARPVDGRPAPGSLTLVDEISVHGGGCALNTASALVSMGLEAAVVGKLGADPLVLERLDGEPLARIAAEARSRGILTSLDTVWDPSGRWSRVEPCLPELDLAFPSLAEGRAISGEEDPPRVAAWFRGRGVREVALTMGDGGCFAAGDTFEGYVAAPVVDAVDGTGAGDAFAAGVLYGKLAGWTFERSVRLGSAAGAAAATTVGATLGGRGLADVLALGGLE